MKKVKVFVSRYNTYAVSDLDIEDWYTDILRDLHFASDTIVVATGTMLDRLRLGHKMGELQIECVEFDGQQIEVDINGNLEYWPKGLFDQHENIMAKLAGWEVDKTL